MFSRIRTILPVLRNIPRINPKFRPMIRSMIRPTVRSMSSFQTQPSTDNHNVDPYNHQIEDEIMEIDYYHLQSVLHANNINFATYLNVREYDFQSKE